MATLSDLRAKVRSQTQTTAAELDNTEVDGWLQEAFDRTIAMENEWPFYEHSWDLVLQPGDPTVPAPTSPGVKASGIVSLVDATSGNRLMMVDQEWAEDFFNQSTVAVGGPTHYSLWANTIYLWPVPGFSEERTFRLRGFRQPEDWIGGGAGAVPDCSSRLHLALANYAIALAYVQQEDEVLEKVYMERWQRDVEAARRAIMDPGRDRPLTMGPRYITPIGYQSWTGRSRGWTF